MLAARYFAPRDVRLEELSEPEPRKDEVVLKVLASNMCGTDLKAYQRGHPLMKPPMTMGHEYAGLVSSVGSSVTRFKRGDRVVASNSAPCGQCGMCKKGSFTLCDVTQRELLGFSIPGSYAEFVRLPGRIVRKNAYKFSSSTPAAEIACAEPLAAVIHALDRAKPRMGSWAAVIGSGALGLMFLQLLKNAGLNVIMVNRSVGRLEIAERLGADQIVEADESNLVDSVRSATGGLGADLVVEAVGKKETWESAFRAARNGGGVLLFGGCAAGTNVSFEAQKMHYGETNLIGSFHHEPSAFRRAVKHIESGRVKVKPLLSARMKLQDIQSAFQKMEKREALKITVVP
jgi:L-iditol 2-dehydrogenase